MRFKNSEFELAGTGRRFAAWVIDGLLLAMVGFVVDFVVVGCMASFFAAILEAGGDVEDMSGSGWLLLAFLLLSSLLFHFLYYGLFWTNGATLGQRMLGVRIIRMDGGRMTGTDVLVRYLVRIISGAFLALGFIRAFFDRLNQTWHDKAAGTLVVREGTRVVLLD